MNSGLDRLNKTTSCFLVSRFKSQTRKFHVVAADVQRQRGVADLEFDLRTEIDSLLEKDVQNLLSDLVCHFIII